MTRKLPLWAELATISLRYIKFRHDLSLDSTNIHHFILPLSLRPLLLGQPSFISALLLCKALLLVGLLLATGVLAGFLLLVISIALSMAATLRSHIASSLPPWRGCTIAFSISAHDNSISFPPFCMRTGSSAP